MSARRFPVLFPGKRCSAVGVLQSFLKGVSHDGKVVNFDLKVSGVYDDQTGGAVAKLQRASLGLTGLAVSGNFGQNDVEAVAGVYGLDFNALPTEFPDQATATNVAFQVFLFSARCAVKGLIPDGVNGPKVAESTKLLQKKLEVEQTGQWNVPTKLAIIAKYGIDFGNLPTGLCEPQPAPPAFVPLTAERVAEIEAMQLANA